MGDKATACQPPSSVPAPWDALHVSLQSAHVNLSSLPRLASQHCCFCISFEQKHVSRIIGLAAVVKVC
jgi:hypothetical protein